MPEVATPVIALQGFPLAVMVLPRSLAAVSG